MAPRQPSTSTRSNRLDAELLSRLISQESNQVDRLISFDREDIVPHVNYVAVMGPDEDEDSLHVV